MEKGQEAAQVTQGEIKHGVSMPDEWRTVITVGQWQCVLTRRLVCID